MELTGTIIEIYPSEVTRTRKTIKRFVLQVEEKWEHGSKQQYYPIQLFEKRIKLLDGISVGDLVKVTVNVDGVRYGKPGEYRYFVNLNAWHVERG